MFRSMPMRTDADDTHGSHLVILGSSSGMSFLHAFEPVAALRTPVPSYRDAMALLVGFLYRTPLAVAFRASHGPKNHAVIVTCAVLCDCLFHLPLSRPSPSVSAYPPLTRLDPPAHLVIQPPRARPPIHPREPAPRRFSVGATGARGDGDGVCGRGVDRHDSPSMSAASTFRTSQSQ